MANFIASKSRLSVKSCILMSCILAGAAACSSSVLQRHNSLSYPGPVHPGLDYSNTREHIPSLNNQGYLSSGSVVLSKTLPAVTTVQSIQSSESRLFSPIVGYIPDRFLSHAGPSFRLELDLGKNSLVLFEGNKQIASAKADGSLNLTPGAQLSIKLKEKHPAWYAPDSYFTSRGLSVPRPSDHESRLRRGALGELALFLSDGQVIHSAHWWTSEVGGWRVNETALKSIFEKIESGTRVEIVSNNANQ